MLVSLTLGETRQHTTYTIRTFETISAAHVRQRMFGNACSATHVRQHMFGNTCSATHVQQHMFGNRMFGNTGWATQVGQRRLGNKFSFDKQISATYTAKRIVAMYILGNIHVHTTPTFDKTSANHVTIPIFDTISATQCYNINL